MIRDDERGSRVLLRPAVGLELAVRDDFDLELPRLRNPAFFPGRYRRLFDAQSICSGLLGPEMIKDFLIFHVRIIDMSISTCQ